MIGVGTEGGPPTGNGIDRLVLEEFRLRAADTAGDASRIVAGFAAGIEPAVPLLTSIEDRRDVAIVRALHVGETEAPERGERDTLDALISSRQPAKRYGPRIAERSEVPPSSYRLAVTESGINDVESDAFRVIPRVLAKDATSRVGLLWIGVPVTSHAGLLVLLGDDEQDAIRPDPRVWPLPVSRDLGVRIYESRG